MFEKIPKSLYELLNLINIYHQFENFISIAKFKETQNYYLELQKIVGDLIQKSAAIMNICLGDLCELDKEKNNQRSITKTIEQIQQFEQQKNLLATYHNEVACHPLFKRIQAGVEPEEKERLECILQEKIGLQEPYPDIYGLTDKMNRWSNQIKDYAQKNQLSTEECEMLLQKIEYISDYYFNIIKGTQDTFETEIIRKVRAM